MLRFSNEYVICFSLSRLQDKLQANNINENQTSGKKNSQHDNNTKGRERKVLTRLPPGATSAGVFPSPPPRGVLVIRTPRCPDGTKGFLKRQHCVILYERTVNTDIIVSCIQRLFPLQKNKYCMRLPQIFLYISQYIVFIKETVLFDQVRYISESKL